jgi:hypothetical protein
MFDAETAERDEIGLLMARGEAAGRREEAVGAGAGSSGGAGATA